ncbi:MAG: hypothetical protein KF900_14595, partial [Bacteroidetes bacterium]|nr:hypothetical protein [Bacteroidota bacterium]
MNKNYSLLFLSVLTLAFFNSKAQTPHIFNYTGAVQTLTLPAGLYQVECWGANGGSITSVGGQGRGGYSSGELLILTSGTQLNILVGGRGVEGSGLLSGNPGAGGWNGGGGGSKIGVSGSGGGGATDVRVSGLAANNRVIVAGGGGGAAGYYTHTPNGLIAAGGNGGGVTAANGNIITSGGVITVGGGGQGANGATPGLGSVGGTSNGTAAGGGGGAYSGSSGSSVGQPGTGGGAGGAAGISGSGSTGCASGGGGGYAGGAGGVQTNNAGVAGGGGSSYIGGVTNGVTIMFGQSGFVTNPVSTGNGYVIITPLIFIDVTASSAHICSGNSTTLTASGVNTYTWLPVGGFGGSNSASISVNPTVTTVYTVQGTNTLGLSTTNTIQVNVFGSLPSVAANISSTLLCSGNTATVNYTGTGVLTHTWSHGLQTGTSFVPATGINNYTLTAQNSCGTVTSVTSITVNPTPTLVISTTTNQVCAGGTTTLSVTGANAYTWTTVSQTGSQVVVSPGGTSNYVVNGLSALGCPSSTTQLISVVAPPNVQISGPSTSLCVNSPITLNASGASSYTWFSGSNATSETTVVTGFTTYTVVGMNGNPSNNCITTAVYNASVDFAVPSPTVNASATVICSGNQVTLFAIGATTYTWTDGTNNFVNNMPFVPNSTATYTLTGGNSCGSSLQETVTVIVNPTPTLQIESSHNSVCQGSSVSFTASGADNYVWLPGGFTGSHISLSPTGSITYTLSGSSNLGCPAASNVTKPITVNALPNVGASINNSVACGSGTTAITRTFNGSGASSYTWTNGGTVYGNAQALTVNTSSMPGGLYYVTG